MVEGTFPTGTYLVTVHRPVSTEDGDLEKALYGSFLPVPSNEMFPLPDASEYEDTKQPGAIVAVKGESGIIKLNEGRKRIKLRVKSVGDRPIQVRQGRHMRTQNTRLMTIGRIALSLYRDEPSATIRPRTSARLPT